jgi:HEAT repeat protein
MGGLAESTWIIALRHPDSHVRWHAARALGQFGDPRAVDVLAQGLFDENHAVRWATAQVLASLDAAAIPAILKTLAEHPLDEQYRQVVYHALHAMPAAQTQEYLRPLLHALSGASAAVEAPCVAQRILSEWKTH